MGRTKLLAQPRIQKLTICTEVRTKVIDAFIALANAIIITREGWTRYRWTGRPTRKP